LIEIIMQTLKITQIGNSLGVILPKEILGQLKVEKGDQLFWTEAPDGYRITPYRATAEAQLKAGRDFMHDYRNTFRELAK
jgi:putative addiction module antidote